MDMEKIYQAMPTVRWREGIYPYSDSIIEESEKAFHTFIHDLEGLGSAPQRKDIMNCVKAVVIKFNEIDEEYSFIETVEREHLCDYIYIAAQMAGLDVDGSDLTEEWREW